METTYPSRIAIDPGHTTGIAVLKENKVVLTVTIDHESLDSAFLVDLILKWRPEELVIESVPTLFPDRITVKVFNFTCELFTSWGVKVLTVSPGIWKPIRKKIKPFWREHIKDAVDLAHHDF